MLLIPDFRTDILGLVIFLSWSACNICAGKHKKARLLNCAAHLLRLFFNSLQVFTGVPAGMRPEFHERFDPEKRRAYSGAFWRSAARFSVFVKPAYMAAAMA